MSAADLLVGAVAAFAIAIVTTPAGVSGALVLLPVQVSVLHVPNPALTPTNLLYNVLATPGALWRMRTEGRGRSPLVAPLLSGAVPGVVAGAVLRVEVLSGPQVFLVVVAAVLGPLGLWLLLGGPPDRARRGPSSVTVRAVAFGAGLIGGVYGIGGGSLLGPVLVALGVSVSALAPAALTSTWLTSIVGVLAYQVLQLAHGDGAIAPEWALGAAMGLGGAAGAYCGARLAPRVPEHGLRRLLGAICVLLAVRYALQGLGVVGL